jgi:hypothetical protein
MVADHLGDSSIVVHSWEEDMVAVGGNLGHIQVQRLVGVVDMHLVGLGCHDM